MNDIRKGQYVFWHDPDGGKSSGVYRVTAVCGEDEEAVYTLKNGVGSEAEAFIGELSYVLTNEEADVLDKIATESKMDAWFWIAANQASIRDRENNRNIPLKRGIRELYEGMVHYCDYRLTKGEIKTFEGVCSKLGIKIDKEYLNRKG